MPAKRFRVGHKQHWDKDQSAAVMKRLTEKKGRGEPIPMDPAVEAVKESLEENVAAFMSQTSDIVQKYREYLDACVPPAYIHERRKLTVLPELGDAGVFHTLRESFQREEAAVSRQATSDFGLEKSAADTCAGGECDAAKVAGPPEPDRSRVIQLLIVEEDEEEDEDDEESAAATAAEAQADSSDDESDEEAETAEQAPEIVLPDNRLLLKQLHILRREAYALSTTFNGIHDLIAFMIPSSAEMEGTDGTTATVMAAVMQQALSLAEVCSENEKMESQYLSDRLDAEVSAQKHPDCYTFQDALISLEVDTWDQLKRSWWAMTRITLIMHTVLARNWKLVSKGRSTGHTNMFM